MIGSVVVTIVIIDHRGVQRSSINEKGAYCTCQHPIYVGKGHRQREQLREQQQ